MTESSPMGYVAEPPAPVNYLPQTDAECEEAHQALPGAAIRVKTWITIVNNSDLPLVGGKVDASWGEVRESPASYIPPNAATLVYVQNSTWGGPQGVIRYRAGQPEKGVELKYNNPLAVGSASYSAEGGPPGYAWSTHPGQYPDKRHLVSFVFYKVRPEQPQAGPFSDWMAQQRRVLESQTLSSISMPSSHNSATYDLSDDICTFDDTAETLEKIKKYTGGLALGVIKGWASCQFANIEDQLRNGIRCLDIRVSWDEAHEVRTEHGLMGPHVKGVLQQVRDFSNAFPTEFVVIQMRNYKGMDKDSMSATMDMAIDTIGKDKIIPANLWNKSLGELWGMSGRILILTDHHMHMKNVKDLCVPRTHWVNCNNLGDLKTRMETRLLTKLDPNRFHDHCMLLTETTDNIKDGFLHASTKPHTMYGFSGPVVYQTIRWFSHDWLKNDFNVLSADYTEGTGLVWLCMNKNLARHAQQMETATQKALPIPAQGGKYRFKVTDSSSGEIRRFAQALHYPGLKATIEKIFGTRVTSVSYVDTDGDVIKVSSDCELEECARVLGALPDSNGIVRLAFQ